MKLKLDINTTTMIPRNSMKLLGSWPVPKDADKWTYAKQQICWCLSLMLSIYGELWVTYYLVSHFSDIDGFIQGFPEFSLLLSQFVKQVICKIYNDSLWEVVSEFNRFLATASPEELEFLNNELRLVYVVHAIYILGCILDPIVFTFTPFIDGRDLPAHVKYPWSIDSSFAYATGYTMQALVAGTLSCMANMDVMFATMLWCIVIRFRYLARQLSKAATAMDIRKCAKEQDDLISQSMKIANIARWMALVIVVQIFMMVTSGGVLVLLQPPFHELVIYAMMVFDGVAELMVYSWAADSMVDVCDELAYAGFQCDWYGKPKEMALDIRIIMQRCDHPVMISSPGLLPVISREFFAGIMMTTFSYITTLRAIAN